MSLLLKLSAEQACSLECTLVQLIDLSSINFETRNLEPLDIFIKYPNHWEDLIFILKKITDYQLEEYESGKRKEAEKEG